MKGYINEDGLYCPFNSIVDHLYVANAIYITQHLIFQFYSRSSRGYIVVDADINDITFNSIVDHLVATAIMAASTRCGLSIL